MAEQPKKTHVRNKDNTKQQFLDAVGKLLRTKGFAALKVNDIATTAGLDKKLIYKYFGGRDQLVDQYLISVDFWSNVKKEDANFEINDGGHYFAKQMLTEQFDYVASNREFQKILLWGLSEKRKSLENLADQRELNGEVLLKNITDPFFGDNAENFRAAMAILISGSYYLNMYTSSSNSTFCGIDPSKGKGKEAIKTALKYIVDLLYKDNK
ncbi:TetR/AcrR family transcriptional regulator [Flavobacterium cerinum]|uniref:TetR/AcrR family transcriptional regulator n=1 Tax=Flavobacterium cerinum TaxID=2502784 RepID=A0A3S3QF05_9FLAO|nr:TetR/AcrR family transcriptional regulator [Flavobacterium cerinum]RWW91719.1 TetR/AcrR family transcriptional regulator [Flavobacterium cerinum]